MDDLQTWHDGHGWVGQETGQGPRRRLCLQRPPPQWHATPHQRNGVQNHICSPSGMNYVIESNVAKACIIILQRVLQYHLKHLLGYLGFFQMD